MIIELLPKIVDCFACVKLSPVSHIPKLCQAFRKPIREQNVQLSAMALGLLSCCWMNGHHIVRELVIPFFYLVNWNNLLDHYFFEAFFTPFIFRWLQTAQRSLCFSSLTWNSRTALSSSWMIYKSAQISSSKSLLSSIFLSFRVVS